MNPLRKAIFLSMLIFLLIGCADESDSVTRTGAETEDENTAVDIENRDVEQVEPIPHSEEDSDFKVTLVGTGEPALSMERFGNSTLVQAGEENLLFDVGRGALLRMSEIDVMPGMIDKLFITHLHHDHLLDYPDLLISASLLDHGERNGELQVWGPEGTEHFTTHMQEAFRDDIQNRIEIIGVDESILNATVTEVDEGVVYEGENLEVIAFEVDHGPMEPAYGYRINYKDHSVVISGDTTMNENLIEHAGGTDLLIQEVVAVNSSSDEEYKSEVHENVEAYHTTPEEAGEIFEKVDPGLAVFSHVVTLGVTEEEANFQKRAEKIYDGEVILGEDLMSFEIGEEIKVNQP